MYVDSQLQLSDAQALTATAISTNVAPMDDVVGSGEPMGVFFTVSVAADFTTTDETYSFAVETDDNVGLTSATVLAAKAVLAADLTVGASFVIPIDYTDMEGYIGVRYTLGGTTPTVTVSADVKPMSMMDSMTNYANGYTIS